MILPFSTLNGWLPATHNHSHSVAVRAWLVYFVRDWMFYYSVVFWGDLLMLRDCIRTNLTICTVHCICSTFLFLKTLLFQKPTGRYTLLHVIQFLHSFRAVSTPDRHFNSLCSQCCVSLMPCTSDLCFTGLTTWCTSFFRLFFCLQPLIIINCNWILGVVLLLSQLCLLFWKIKTPGVCV